METLADYGTVQYFGVPTFTTGILRTWFGLDNAAAAAQLSAMLLMPVLLLIVLERMSRRRARYHYTSERHQAIRRNQLSGRYRAVAICFCLALLVMGFLLPAGQLLWWTFKVSEEAIDGRFLRLIGNSLTLAGAASALALLLAITFGYVQRLSPTWLVHAAVRIASMGYAVPGAVIAVGVMIPFAAADNALDAWLRSHFGVSTGLLLSGTVFALLFAYLVRFLAISLNTVEAGLGRIRPTMDEAARSMGYRPLAIAARVHAPLLKGSLLTALLLVFVDVLKELPATLILRPFNVNTLAVRAYELASDERLADAAPAALTIVAVGILPVILLSRTITQSRHVQTARNGPA